MFLERLRCVCGPWLLTPRGAPGGGTLPSIVTADAPAAGEKGGQRLRRGGLAGSWWARARCGVEAGWRRLEAQPRREEGSARGRWSTTRRRGERARRRRGAG